jgi:hypothetical protein
LLRWRYFDVTHEGIIYHKGALISTGLWHLFGKAQRGYPINHSAP